MAPDFVRYVSAVEGRLVTRWDSLTSYFGARRSSAEERKAGAEPIVWDLEQVVPLTDAFCRRFDKELRQALRNQDLKERTEQDYRTWLGTLEKREKARDAELAKAKAAKPEPAPKQEP